MGWCTVFIRIRLPLLYLFRPFVCSLSFLSNFNILWYDSVFSGCFECCMIEIMSVQLLSGVWHLFAKGETVRFERRQPYPQEPIQKRNKQIICPFLFWELERFFQGQIPPGWWYVDFLYFQQLTCFYAPNFEKVGGAYCFWHVWCSSCFFLCKLKFFNHACYVL